MAFNFDDEWLRRLNRQMEEIRRAFASPAIEAALRQVRSIQPQLDQINRVLGPQLDAVNRVLGPQLVRLLVALRLELVRGSGGEAEALLGSE